MHNSAFVRTFIEDGIENGTLVWEQMELFFVSCGIDPRRIALEAELAA